MRDLDFLDKAIHKIQKQFEEFGLLKSSLEEYKLSTEQILEYTNINHFPVEVSKNKLSYYVQHQMIPAPKRVSIADKVSGSMGKYKVKTIFIIWYIAQLQERGIKSHDEIRKHIYNYFSEQLPPIPVTDTPLAERIVYAYRTNQRVIYIPPIIKEISIPLYSGKEIVEIPAVTLLHSYQDKPLSFNLVLKRNISHSEAQILEIMRKDEHFISEHGFKVFSEDKGSISEKKLLDLHIFKNYPIESKKDSEISYLDLLDENLTYESL